MDRTERVDELVGGVDAEQVIDGRCDVARGDGVAGGIGGPTVAGTEDCPPLDPRTGEYRREAMRPVVAAVYARAGAADNRLADSRRAAEFARPDDQRRVEQPAHVEIVEQGAKAWSAGGIEACLSSQ